MLHHENEAVATGHAGIPTAPATAGDASLATPSAARDGFRSPSLWLGVAGAGIVGAVTAKAVAAAVRDTALANLTLVQQTETGTYRLLAVLMVLALVGGTLLPRRWNGWPLVTVGSAVAFASTTAEARNSIWYVFGFVVGAGAALAGALSAVAAARPAGRWVLGAALAIGFVASGEVTRLTHWGNVVAKDALVATVLTAALSAYTLLRRPATPAAPDGPAQTGRFARLRRAPVVLAAAAVVTLALDEALRGVNLALRHGQGLSDRRYHAVELVTHYGHVAIAVVLTGALAAVAWRAGAARQARWIVIGAGLAAMLYSGPDALGDLALSPLGGWATLALPAAAAIGAALAWYVAGAVPWDAYALLIGAVATVAASVLPDTAGTAHATAALSHMALVSFAVALGAGLAEIAGADPGAGGWSGTSGPVAGFAVFVLVAAQFAVDPLLNISLSDRGSLYGAIVAVVCAAGAWALAVRGTRGVGRATGPG